MYRIDVSYFLEDFEKDFDDSFYMDYVESVGGDSTDSGAGFGARDMGFEFESLDVARDVFDKFKSFEKTQYLSLSEILDDEEESNIISEHITKEFKQLMENL